MIRTTTILLLSLAAGCYSTSDVANGKLHCSAAGECPESFSCVDGVCWRGGIVLGGDDMSISGDDLGDEDLSLPETPQDLAGVDLRCSADTDCPAGYYCPGMTSCMPQTAVDGTCSMDDECVTGYCYMTKCTTVALNWVKIAAFNFSFYNNNALAFPFPDGRVFALDGDGGNLTVATFNVTTRAVGSIANTPNARVGAGAATNGSNALFLFGGQPSVQKNMISFTGTAWSATTDYAPMPTGRYNHACTNIGTSIYCGGGTDSSTGNLLTSFETYTPGGGWSTLAAMPLGYSSFAMATLNNKIYAVGGYTGSNAQPNASVYSGGVWSNITSLTTPRSDLGLAAGPDGRLYAVGGNDGDDVTTVALDSVEAYSPALNRWVTLTTKMTDKRYTFGLTTGADGRIYAVGGFGYTGSAAFRIGYTDAYGPDLHLSSTTPAVGSTLMITGNNLAPNARVTVTFDGTVVASSTSDQFGGLNATSFMVPNVPSGAHQVIVVDHRSRYPITLYLTIP
jgi:hypothetical protein